MQFAYQYFWDMLSYLPRVLYSYYDSYRGTKTDMLKNANWQSKIALQMDWTIKDTVLPKKADTYHQINF